MHFYTNGVKGIILAGGNGTRLRPVTRGVSKQLLPIYDKPMIYYPLSTLMLAGLREILIITTPHDHDAFERLLGDGRELGISLHYETQAEPRGLADALIVGEKFLDGDSCALILGDNLFFGDGLGTRLAQYASISGALVFAHQVSNPSAYGVVTFDEEGRVLRIEEKPDAPASSFVVPGLYFYDHRASEFAHAISPSARGELEITDLNNEYLRRGELRVEILSRATTWLDMGTFESLYEAGGLIRALQSRTGLRIGDIEDVATLQGWR